MSWNRALPYGTRDKLFGESRQMTETAYKMMAFFYTKGYRQIETPTFEYKDVFSRGREEREQRLYQFFDDRGRTLALRPDMTLPIGRVVSTIGLKGPLKLTYSGKVFRVFDDYTGKNNEQMQTGIEIIGGDPLKAEVEAVATVIQSLQAVGLDDTIIEIGHAEIYQSLCSELGLDEEQRLHFASLLTSKSLSGIRAFAAEHPQEKAFLLELPRLFGETSLLTHVRGLTTSRSIHQAIDRIEALVYQLTLLGYGTALSVDLGMVQTFEYYTGVIFRGYATSSATEFLSGGRYDDLFQRFEGQKRAAVGVGVNLDEIVRLKQQQQSELTNKAIRTLIHYEEAAVVDALKRAQGPLNELSVCETVVESREYALEHGFQTLVICQKDGVTTEPVEKGETS
ncbi:ATP phosphoribosyltransferase regulatory subunit [Brochothrix thermosphacta]|uniref:ATP phosphoribosyltransferase regulatory subunit n=1 Tax=Brochothrix thermosphacta TaxID=2756 RepID=UPI003F969D84